MDTTKFTLDDLKKAFEAGYHVSTVEHGTQDFNEDYGFYEWLNAFINEKVQETKDK